MKGLFSYSVFQQLLKTTPFDLPLPRSEYLSPFHVNSMRRVGWNSRKLIPPHNSFRWIHWPLDHRPFDCVHLCCNRHPVAWPIRMPCSSSLGSSGPFLTTVVGFQRVSAFQQSFYEFLAPSNEANGFPIALEGGRGREGFQEIFTIVAQDGVLKRTGGMSSTAISSL